MPTKVFISYSHQDGNTAHGIARFLSRHGLDVWIDAKNLTLGNKWSEDIETAISTADCAVAIISAASVRRAEVLKEIRIALERTRNDKNFLLFFVVIGKIHNSWFKNNSDSKEIIDYLNTYQYVELSAYGEITIDTMKKLLNGIEGLENEISSDEVYINDEDSDYINQNAVPETAYDSRNNSMYYRVFTADLSSSCALPFALDNQWLPEIINKEGSIYFDAFNNSGFDSDLIRDYLYIYHKNNFYLSLIHNKQIIISRNTLLYSPFFQKILLSEKTNQERNSFTQLLSNGSIVILLYGNGEVSPFIHDTYNFIIDSKVIEAWNQICLEIPIYCIRENWAVPVDQHSIEILRFVTNLAMDRRHNVLLGKSMGVADKEMDDFLATLKNISMQSFCQTHMNGTENYRLVDGYSRSSFYKNYVVKYSYDDSTVLKCIYDDHKPFHSELKRIIDIFYNSLFTNCFKCEEMLPNDVEAKNLYLNRMYLSTSNKEVSIEEAEFAFAEFFECNDILKQIKRIGSWAEIENWDLHDILALRRKEEWVEYVEFVEIIQKRSKDWKVDFNEIELLTKRFVNCFDNLSNTEYKYDASYSFRVCIGYNVIDIVGKEGGVSIKTYETIFDNNQIVPLVIQFSIGDITAEDRINKIFAPVTLFDGKIDTSNSETFYNNLYTFLTEMFR